MRARLINFLVIASVLGVISLFMMTVLLPCDIPYRGRKSWPHRFHIIYWVPPLLAITGAVMDDYDRQRRLKKRRMANGCCRECECELTNNVLGACPKCGTAVPESTPENPN